MEHPDQSNYILMTQLGRKALFNLNQVTCRITDLEVKRFKHCVKLQTVERISQAEQALLETKLAER